MADISYLPQNIQSIIHSMNKEDTLMEVFGIEENDEYYSVFVPIGLKSYCVSISKRSFNGSQRGFIFEDKLNEESCLFPILIFQINWNVWTI